MPPTSETRTLDAFHAFHRAACAALGIAPGHGSNGRVAEAVGASGTQYSNVLAGRSGSLDLLSRWASVLGLEILIPPARPIEIRATAHAKRRDLAGLIGPDPNPDLAGLIGPDPEPSSPALIDELVMLEAATASRQRATLQRATDVLVAVGNPCDGGGRGGCGSLLRLVVGHGAAVPGMTDLRCVRCGASSVIRPADLAGATA